MTSYCPERGRDSLFIDSELVLVPVQSRSQSLEGTILGHKVRMFRAASWFRSIIAITAYALKYDREWFTEAEMDDYIPTPVEKEELEKVLKD
jgi:two-component SAPR family response regulator